MSIFDKENAILAGQVAQGQILSQIATAIANIPSTGTGDNTALLAAIAAVDTHVSQVQALIGSDTPAPTPEPAPAA